MHVSPLLTFVFFALGAHALVPRAKFSSLPQSQTAPSSPTSVCKQGQFACSGSNILVCNSSGQFTVAANCGSEKCAISGGSVFCQ
ncbi:hypothetical protein PsYK624_049820 [Phanerochaete sordida]|uniref:Uncharacterized protein n=1 Tax=Phanerochaete sordida TaxID=48140 RepID=A0A9P3G6U8_9APHY|nr:hypothetical protein PsYK624_049820 [Phanerochaete sordida]